MKKLNFIRDKKENFPQSPRGQLPKATLVNLYIQWTNYAKTMKLKATEYAEINRLEDKLYRYLPEWHDELLAKHVLITEKGDWGVTKDLAEIDFASLSNLEAEWKVYQKLVGRFIKPEIKSKINFVSQLKQKILQQKCFQEYKPPPTTY